LGIFHNITQLFGQKSPNLGSFRDITQLFEEKDPNLEIRLVLHKKDRQQQF
jgi:hypothetical protein